MTRPPSSDLKSEISEEARHRDDVAALAVKSNRRASLGSTRVCFVACTTTFKKARRTTHCVILSTESHKARTDMQEIQRALGRPRFLLENAPVGARQRVWEIVSYLTHPTNPAWPATNLRDAAAHDQPGSQGGLGWGRLELFGNKTIERLVAMSCGKPAHDENSSLRGRAARPTTKVKRRSI